MHDGLSASVCVCVCMCVWLAEGDGGQQVSQEKPEDAMQAGGLRVRVSSGFSVIRSPEGHLEER